MNGSRRVTSITGNRELDIEGNKSCKCIHNATGNDGKVKRGLGENMLSYTEK